MALLKLHHPLLYFTPSSICARTSNPLHPQKLGGGGRFLPSRTVWADSNRGGFLLSDCANQGEIFPHIESGPLGGSCELILKILESFLFGCLEVGNEVCIFFKGMGPQCGYFN
ncbi:hypothetical protein Adt_19861 [Abeliophyllum distichum]|uniref:Uncharacterized protein n=1 Tax=Abeliophyllum distichum TaxID=126358 RepID=A0ABD1SU82_9LAMI